MTEIMKGKYDASGMATLIINYLKEKNEKIDHLKLQKLLYFIAAEWFKKYGVYPYKQATEKWKLGPVIREVYSDYRSSGSMNISEPATQLIIKDGVVRWDIVEACNLTDDELSSVENVIDEYSKYDSFTLVDMTHDHTPWKENEKNILNPASISEKYSLEDFRTIVGEI